MITILKKRAQWCAIAAFAVVTITACPDHTSPPTVASVQITSINTNPRVGEVTHVSATPVNDGGVQVQGVACTYASGTPAVASIDATTGTITAISVGTTVITAACGGKSNTVTITVRPPLVTLTINQAGTGSGSVLATPASGSYDQGTTVSIAATAATGSTFSGWGGACTGTTSPCSLLMDANKTVTATFTAGTVTLTNVTLDGCSPPTQGNPLNVRAINCKATIYLTITKVVTSGAVNVTMGYGSGFYHGNIAVKANSQPGAVIVPMIMDVLAQCIPSQSSVIDIRDALPSDAVQPLLADIAVTINSAC